MANSDLHAFEIELIRSMAGKENKTFEEALQAVRPGSKVVYEQPTIPNVNNTKSSQNKRAALLFKLITKLPESY